MTPIWTWTRRVALAATGACLLAAPAMADPSIWRVSDEDSDIYLFGTVHILRADVEWRTPEVMAAFEAADTVYFEAPVNDPAQAAGMMPLVQQYGLNAAGEPLSSMLGDDGNAALARIAPEVGLSAAMLEPFRPWLASVTVTVQYISTQGYDPNSGVEAVLWPMASEAGKTLAYFETLEEQLGFFGDLPRDIEVEMLEQTLDQIEDAPGMLDGLVTAWANGDQATIDRLMNGEFREGSPEVYQVIIVDRNERWVDDIQTLLDGSGTVFVAVGAGHLPGEQGVVNLLRAEGITVEGP
tara:strand:- start:3031 stop:3918 length:888 start_codon:yes stop_codon:yes gene_type:complete